MSNKEKMFYKVYQDKESMGTYYVDDAEGMRKQRGLWKDSFMDDPDFELFPVIEPVMMTQKEFDDLPEFQGY